MTPADDGSLVAFSDLLTAAYCPRKYYYRDREDDREPPPEVGNRRALAFRYSDLLAADVAALAAEPIAVDPSESRRNLEATRARFEEIGRWEAICEPTGRDAYAAGKDCHGIVHKVLEDPLEPSIVSVGEPPEQGIWHAQSVHAVGAAKVLAWDRRQGSRPPTSSTPVTAWSAESRSRPAGRPSTAASWRPSAGWRGCPSEPRTARSVTLASTPGSVASGPGRCGRCSVSGDRVGGWLGGLGSKPSSRRS